MPPPPPNTVKHAGGKNTIMFRDKYLNITQSRKGSNVL